jgi:hypothetical protein
MLSARLQRTLDVGLHKIVANIKQPVSAYERERDA